MTTLASLQTPSPAGRADRTGRPSAAPAPAPAARECTCAAATEKEHLPVAAFAPFVLTVAALLALGAWTDLGMLWRVGLAVALSAAGTAVVAGVERAVRGRRRRV